MDKRFSLSKNLHPYIQLTNLQTSIHTTIHKEIDVKNLKLQFYTKNAMQTVIQKEMM